MIIVLPFALQISFTLTDACFCRLFCPSFIKSAVSHSLKIFRGGLIFSRPYFEKSLIQRFYKSEKNSLLKHFQKVVAGHSSLRSKFPNTGHYFPVFIRTLQVFIFACSFFCKNKAVLKHFVNLNPSL